MHASAALLVGIDIGTTNLKVVATRPAAIPDWRDAMASAPVPASRLPSEII